MHKGTATLDPSFRLGWVVVAWLLAATAVGASGVIARAPYIVPVITVGAITVGIASYRRRGRVRAQCDAIDIRRLLAIHLIRVPIGIGFLVQMSRGIMPELFAMRAGPGDIVIGLLAVAVILAMPATTSGRRAFLVAWSIAGILDLMLAFGTAQYLLFVVGDERIRIVGHLPYALLPQFIVPIVILSHLLVLARLRGPSCKSHVREADLF